MKRCPTCTRTFLDEQLSYCTDDGTPLVAQAQSSSFDPQATILNPTPPTTRDIGDPPPTRAFGPDDMPGGWPAPHAWSQPSSPPAPVQPSWNAPSTPPAAWTPPPPPGGQFGFKKSQQNPVAIASLAVGVFSLTVGLYYLGFCTGPVAIVLGVIAMVQLKNNPSQSAGKGMAIAGIATGAVSFGIVILIISLSIALSR